MAINQNHTFDELDGIKCAIVEKLASPERVAFLKRILEYNHFTVVVVPSPPPKVVAAPKPAPVAGLEVPVETSPPVPPPPPPETFTIGVTDVTFNPTNAIFGRLLKVQGGHVVTLAYWQQKDNNSHDEVPYFSNSQ
ncbi:MAG: hypothetical protein ABIN89_18585 [Chitinophagaceae bacterium]